MTPIWFPRPFHVICGGHIEQGTENEDQILFVLQKYIKNLSGEFLGITKGIGNVISGAADK